MKEYLEKQLQYCGNKALDSTCQLFYKSAPIGSGVLLEINKHKYLVSAAHVLEPQYVEWMTIPNGEDLVEIEGKLVTTEIPKSGERSDDKMDLGIVQLSEDCAKGIEKRFHFLNVTDIDADHSELPSHQYMFCGYPVETTEVKRMEMIIEPIPLKIRTRIINKKFTTVPTYIKGSKWILDFDRNQQFNIVKRKEEPTPSIVGISGAGLWSIYCTPNMLVENTNMKLIGILTHHFWTDKVVCATNISVVLAIIKKEFENAPNVR